MRLVKTLPLLLLMVAGSAFSYDRDLSFKANSLERAAYRLAHTIRHRSGYSHAHGSARRFAREVRHFRRSVQNHASIHHLNRDFRHIRTKYNRLMHNVNRSHRLHHSRHVSHDIRAMRHKFRRLHDGIHHRLGHH